MIKRTSTIERQIRRLCFWLALAGPHAVLAAQESRARPIVEPRSYGTRRETDPPRYVRTLGGTGLPGTEPLYWLDLGLDQRTRFERRDNDFRRAIGAVDHPVLLRVRAYLGVQQIFDPFRFTVELEDARRYLSEFPRDDKDWNAWEPIQAFAELYFGAALGEHRPLRLRIGRMAFEAVDRRFIARNEWRNTTNTFQGARLSLGQDSNDWQADLMALAPLSRRLGSLDRATPDRWFFAAIGTWRGRSEIVTLQPYWMWLQQGANAGASPASPAREIHAVALRGYAVVGETGLDYDVNIVGQFGRDAGRTHRALGVVTEFGYTLPHPVTPRLSAFYGYGSGDRDPNDGRSERFERFFGFARPWSNNDYFQWENLHAPKGRLELTPHKSVRIDTGYCAYWLASATDRWNGAMLRDPTGQSGTFVGQELDARVRWKALARVEVTAGYAHFAPGRFTRTVGRSEVSHFAYVELSVSAFE